MAKLNARQLGAIFEKLKAAKLGTNVSKPHSKMLTPPVPPMAPKPPSMRCLPNSNEQQADKVNPDYIGKPRHQRFKKLKNIFGI